MAKWLFAFITMLFVSGATYAASDMDKELLYRLRFSSLADVKLLLDHGASPDAVSEEGLPALSAALERTDNNALDAMKLLIAKGANVNAGGPAGRPPLIEAVKAGDFTIVKYLVEEGKADIHVRDKDDYDALAEAKYLGHTEMIKYFNAVVEAQKSVKTDTPEFKAKQIHALGYSTCARQYLSYYYNSKQDSIPAAVQKAQLDKYTKDMQTGASDLMQVFNFPANALLRFQQDVAKAIADELNGLISNRNRRENGVGKEEDMQKRCEKTIKQVQLKEK